MTKIRTWQPEHLPGIAMGRGQVDGEEQPQVSPLYILGLGHETWADAAARLMNHPLVVSADVLIGGGGLLALLDGLRAVKVPVGKDITGLLEQIAVNRTAGKTQVVLCGGDPLYYSLGGSLVRYLQTRFPDTKMAEVRVIPGVSSLQAAAGFLGVSWEEVCSISLHGRADWMPLAHALQTGQHIFILTDKQSSPVQIATFMHERGYDAYFLHILDNLFCNPETGTVHAEAYQKVSVASILEQQGDDGAYGLRSVWLEPSASALDKRDSDRDGSAATTYTDALFGLPDTLISRDRDVLTKLPVRAAGLALLGIAPAHTVWDLGAGSGAVSIEASRLSWRGSVLAVEKNSRRREHMLENRRRFKAAVMEVIHMDIKDFLVCAAEHFLPGHCQHADVLSGKSHTAAELLPFMRNRPDRIFIGGGLSGSGEKDSDIGKYILQLAWELLSPGGRMVAHCVLLGSMELARKTLESLGAPVSIYCIQGGKAKPLAGDMHLEAMNPVFLICAEKVCAPDPAKSNVPLKEYF